ncbi:hypothetical protein B808_1130 [Fructilactobacillus florum 8D]|uniref:Uncharacterized protein n=1 Tax=Fructilactobacillus florum 8D TaxID=1221538 RepID=W9EFI7_9LACO|nr:hypothetical protein [Fructilactobacillus florum]ETO40021.1 hypothetical protein B808_1130 [Fructilactobacillus florum 8D]
MTQKLEGYKKLSKLSYDDAIAFLLKKYGSAKDDYFKEKSYERFLKGEIKSPAKNPIQRTDEGLYVHHIDEISAPDISNKTFIQLLNYEFDLQKADRLVYCDLVEHLILHFIITREATGAQGQGGVVNFLAPEYIVWYIDGTKPKADNPRSVWKLNCYKKSFLSKEEATELLDFLLSNSTINYEDVRIDEFRAIIRKIASYKSEQDIKDQWS